MSSLIETILAELTQDKILGIAQNLGESPDKTSSAVQQALPLLVGAISQKAQNPIAISMLSSLLDKNNDGSMLDDVLRMITGSGNTSVEQKGGMGESLLQLLLGGDSDSVKQRVAAASGIEPSSVAKLLPLLAPIVLSALSKIKTSENLSVEGLGSLLEKESVASKSAATPGSSGLLNQLLDTNNDGNCLDDVVRLGTKILG